MQRPEDWLTSDRTGGPTSSPHPGSLTRLSSLLACMESSALGEAAQLATIRKRALVVPRHGRAGAAPRSMRSEDGRARRPPVLDVPRALDVVLGVMDQLVAGVVIALCDRARTKQSRAIGTVHVEGDPLNAGVIEVTWVLGEI